ncbi:MAG: hypothetical protein ABIJ09_19625 [Pseudomonadota bacterium]
MSGLIACPSERQAVPPAHAAKAPAKGLALSRINEPREQAFSILVPAGWSVSGGIFRVNAATAGGPLNAIEAKCDLTLASQDGLVSLRVLPDIVYAHHGVGAGLFAPGSNYQGATVRPLETALQHLRTLLSLARPAATDVRFVKSSRLPGEIAVLDRAQSYTNNLLRQVGGDGMTFVHDAAGAIIDFSEAGQAYRAAITTAVVDMRAALTWKNTRALIFVAPRASFDHFRPVLDIVRASTRFNPRWVLSESQGQRERADFVVKVFDQMRQIEQDMLAKQRLNREEIMNDNYLVLTGQEEYINPHSGEVEVDTDRFKYRWSTAAGDRYYTDREDADPNALLQGGGYRRSAVRPRRNE